MNYIANTKKYTSKLALMLAGFLMLSSMFFVEKTHADDISMSCQINVSVSGRTATIDWSAGIDQHQLDPASVSGSLSVSNMGVLDTKSGSDSIGGTVELTNLSNGTYTASVSANASVFSTSVNCSSDQTFIISVGSANNKPVITLVGPANITIIQGDSYSDQGATANDIEDGDVTVQLVRSVSVDVNTVGVYPLTYNVVDSQGLHADEVVRVVNVTAPPAQVAPPAPPVNGCADGVRLNVHEFKNAVTSGLIGYTLTINPEQTSAVFAVVNNTNCTAPLSLASYKMFDPAPALASQEIFNKSPLTLIGPAGSISVSLPSCMAQIDGFYGTAPDHLLASNPYDYPNDPYTVVFGYSHSGQYCQNGTTTPAVSADLSISKTANKATANVGEIVTYTISVTNGGPSNATNLAITDILNVGLNFISATTTSGTYATSTGVWIVPNLANGSSTMMTITATIKAGYQGQTIPNIAIVTATEADPNAGNNVSMVNVLVNGVINHPPVITLIGANPVTVTQGQVYTDPGATAQDIEDGNITIHIVRLNPVNTGILGTYVVTYNVQDSQGLHAVQVSRTVNVVPPVVPMGTLRVCIMLADENNVLATSSAGLPGGVFGINIGTTTNIGGSNLFSRTWNTTPTGFVPNAKIILGQNDADCTTYSVPLGTYYYSELSVTGAHWLTAKYNDQNNHSINNVFDFFNYSPELFNATSTDDSARNLNADGQIIITTGNLNQTLVVYEKDDAGGSCPAPQITSSLSATGTVGNPFTYLLTATSSTATTFSVSGLPAGLSFSTTTKTISGTPTLAGVYNVVLSVTNLCAGGIDIKTLILTVNNPGGGGGGASANLSITKTADKASANVGENITYTIIVNNIGPDTAGNVIVTDLFPSLIDIVSASSSIGTFSTTTKIWTIGNMVNGSTATLTIITATKSGTQGQTVTNSVTVSSSTPDPVSANNTATVTTTINTASTGGGGGGGNGGCGSNCGGSNGPIVVNPPTITVPPTTNNGSCYYLLDYLRKDFINNPVEVKKLQVFLRDLEGFSTVQITGVYDDQTIVALDAFQIRYAGDILTPWGHTAPTSYTYILTKKKVNEIYCKRAFPVSSLQQEEIDSYRAFLLGLQNAGIILNQPTTPGSTVSTIIPGEVGSATSTINNQVGIASTTSSVISRMTANVIFAGGKVAGFIVWPFKWLFGLFIINQCVEGFSFGRLFNWLLVIIIIIISYLWYRQYRNNKKIAILNEEIDLVK